MCYRAENEMTLPQEKIGIDKRRLLMYAVVTGHVTGNNLKFGPFGRGLEKGKLNG